MAMMHRTLRLPVIRLFGTSRSKVTSRQLLTVIVDGSRRSLLERRCTIGSRSYSTTSVLSVNTVPITYIEPDGKEKEVQAELGKNLLEVAHENNIELEGACGGELACATCHLIFEKHIYDTLPPKTDEEDDMLDLAFELTETSRLGCQIRVREDFAGMKVRIPNDGF